MGDVVNSMKRALRNGKAWTLVLAAASIWSGCAAVFSRERGASSEPVPPAAAPAALPATISRLAVDGGRARDPDRASGRQRRWSGRPTATRMGPWSSSCPTHGRCRRSSRSLAGGSGLLGPVARRRNQRPAAHAAHGRTRRRGRAPDRRRPEQPAHRPAPVGRPAGSWRRRRPRRSCRAPCTVAAPRMRRRGTGAEGRSGCPEPAAGDAWPSRDADPPASPAAGSLRLRHPGPPVRGAPADRPRGLDSGSVDVVEGRDHGRASSPETASSPTRPSSWKTPSDSSSTSTASSIRAPAAARRSTARFCTYPRLAVQAEPRSRLARRLRPPPDRAADDRARRGRPGRALQHHGACPARLRGRGDRAVARAAGVAAVRCRGYPGQPAASRDAGPRGATDTAVAVVPRLRSLRRRGRGGARPESVQPELEPESAPTRRSWLTERCSRPSRRRGRCRLCSGDDASAAPTVGACAAGDRPVDRPSPPGPPPATTPAFSRPPTPRPPNRHGPPSC